VLRISSGIAIESLRPLVTSVKAVFAERTYELLVWFAQLAPEVVKRYCRRSRGDDGG
jgi:hypothetical protein